jgi:hypothetical protein
MRPPSDKILKIIGSLLAVCTLALAVYKFAASPTQKKRDHQRDICEEAIAVAMLIERDSSRATSSPAQEADYKADLKRFAELLGKLEVFSSPTLRKAAESFYAEASATTKFKPNGDWTGHPEFSRSVKLFAGFAQATSTNFQNRCSCP